MTDAARVKPKRARARIAINLVHFDPDSGRPLADVSRRPAVGDLLYSLEERNRGAVGLVLEVRSGGWARVRVRWERAPGDSRPVARPLLLLNTKVHGDPARRWGYLLLGPERSLERQAAALREAAGRGGAGL